MPSPLGTGRTSTRAGSSCSISATTTAARLPQAPQQVATQSPGLAAGHGHGDVQFDQEQEQEQEHEHEEDDQHRRPEQQQHNSYRHHGGGTRAGYRPAQVRRLPFDMSTYAHFMLTHTMHQMDAVPDAEPPPPHLSIAGLPRGLADRERHANSSRTSTAGAANGMSS